MLEARGTHPPHPCTDRVCALRDGVLYGYSQMDVRNNMTPAGLGHRDTGRSDVWAEA